MNERKHPRLRRLAAFLLALALCLTLAGPALAADDATASSIQLAKTEGTVSATNSAGRSVSLVKNLRLFNGYHVVTSAKSYAWLNLDSAKLLKEDASSNVEVRKSGKKLEVLVSSGNLFFNVTEPLDDDETLNIRTSTTLTGVRGTCGWVEVIDRWNTDVYILEGEVECAVTDPVSGEEELTTISAGETATFTVRSAGASATNGVRVTKKSYDVNDVPGYVLVDLAGDKPLCNDIRDASGMDIIGELSRSGDPAAEAQRRLEAEQAAADSRLASIAASEEAQSNNVESADNTSNTPGTPNTPGNSDMAAQYRSILEKASSYKYGSLTSSGKYRYALVPMQSGNDVPALLLEQLSTWGGVYEGLVFQYVPDSGQVVQASGNLMEGVGETGYRGTIAASADGNGILYMQWSSGTGDGTIERTVLDGSRLQDTTLKKGFLFKNTDPLSEFGYVNITWHDISDLSGLDSNVESAPNSSVPPAVTPAPAATPTDGNRTVLTGTVRLCTYADLVELSGGVDPNGGGYGATLGTTQVIVLDTPQNLTLRSGAGLGSYSSEAKCVTVYSADISRYAGQKITFSIDPAKTYWPSGTNLPLGQPSTSDIHVLS